MLETAKEKEPKTEEENGLSIEESSLTVKCVNFTVTGREKGERRHFVN